MLTRFKRFGSLRGRPQVEHRTGDLRKQIRCLEISNLGWMYPPEGLVNSHRASPRRSTL